MEHLIRLIINLLLVEAAQAAVVVSFAELVAVARLERKSEFQRQEIVAWIF